MTAHSCLSDKLGVVVQYAMRCNLLQKVLFDRSIELIVVLDEFGALRALSNHCLQCFFLHCKFVVVDLALVLVF